YAQKACVLAVDIASKTGAEITLVHSVFTRLDWASMTLTQRQEYPETLGQTTEAEIKLDRLKKSKLFGGIKVNSMVVHGAPYDQITRTAAKYKADLIVMGSHGVNESNEFFIGSNIQKTMRQSSCPIITVKKEYKGTKWKKLVFASNFEENIKKEFEQILMLAKLMGASINLLFVNTPGNFKSTTESMEIMDKFSANFKGVKMTKSIFNHKELHKGIIQHCESVKADWMALVAHDRRRAPQYLIGITETLVYHASIPVLSVNQK
ncbi:MAG TPA: universal stress protein, partial [Cyclobacteriaceae bacterium]|nr:universal stress protein [Cyclobacteriaceae bacterium]